MKKTLIALMALAGVAVADVTLVEMDFTTLTGNSNDNLPAGWSAGQYNGNGNVPYYTFGENGAVVGQPWKQNYLFTNLNIDSQEKATISFTLYNSGEDTGNMFYLSSGTYSIVIGNSYNSNSEIYVGTLNEAVGRDYVCFQPGTKINPTVLANTTNYNVSGDISYTLTMLDGNMTIDVTVGDGGKWSTTIQGMDDVMFNQIGFLTDGATGTAGVKDVTVSVPEPTTATLSLLALAGLAVRRRRK